MLLCNYLKVTNRLGDDFIVVLSAGIFRFEISRNLCKFFRFIFCRNYIYEGADLGILVSRGRMMTDDFKLNARAKNWIKAIHSKYVSTIVEDKREKIVLTGSLTK